VSSVSKSICRLLVVSMGLLSAQAAQADLIATEPAPHAQSRLVDWGVDPADAVQRANALTNAEVASMQLDAQAPAGGDLGTTAVVFILMFVAIFVLSLRPE